MMNIQRRSILVLLLILSHFAAMPARAEFVCFSSKAIVTMTEATFVNRAALPEAMALQSKYCRYGKFTSKAAWKKVAGCQLYKGKTDGKTSYTHYCGGGYNANNTGGSSVSSGIADAISGLFGKF